ncbi:DNA-processing protein DprA [Thalassobacillus sp. CUG 92003]|uniref:DNA-processing protein DprA n=1 Tax=Thalassobacillus sp. CUG 92003 TaxID=2736641 RepID=UPI0015E6F04C|nr:DNA-processing protein DprA [Thalassobacillus sp. CUG 92003]
MNQTKWNLMLLHASPGFTRRRIKALIRANPTLDSLHSFTPQALSTLLKVSFNEAVQLLSQLHNPRLLNKLEAFAEKYHCVTWFDQHYPTLLRHIPDPPLVLYMNGDLTLLDPLFSLSVVGTRTPSREAFANMENVLAPLISKRVTLISGMAAGIDQFAHRLAISYHGKTIAVLGSGFQYIYPKNDIPLYQCLADQHLVISEYVPDQPPRKYQFPERNRIISGLTQATLVVEAKVKSGSLITVSQALEQGREVFAMPGSLQHPTSEGCHKLIQDGAKLVCTADDIIESWPVYNRC